MSRRLPVPALIVVLLAAACERIEAPAIEVQGAQVDVSTPAFARSDARLSVAHAGVRRIEHVRPDGSRETFRERIVTDGRERFSITPLDSPDASIPDWNLFELTQRAREGFLFRYRDFAVRDADLFARNWDCALQGSATVAGRDCTQYRIERKGGEGSAFELAVDATQLVLSCRELDAGGAVRTSMSYESLELDPELSGVVWHVPSNDERAVDAAALAGLTVLRPRLLPRGYRPHETASVSAGDDARWLKATYTDGIETLFFFQALSGVETRAAAPIAMAESAASPGSVLVFEIGAATVLQGEVEGFDLIVIGKAPQDELVDLLESALP